MTHEIYWDDLTPEAQERLKELYHENIELTPLAIIEISIYYALYDNETGRYLQTGINSESIDALLVDFIDYIKNDLAEDETPESYYSKFFENPEELFNMRNFSLESGNEPFEVEEYNDIED